MVTKALRWATGPRRGAELCGGSAAAITSSRGDASRVAHSNPRPTSANLSHQWLVFHPSFEALTAPVNDNNQGTTEGDNHSWTCADLPSRCCALLDAQLGSTPSGLIRLAERAPPTKTHCHERKA